MIETEPNYLSVMIRSISDLDILQKDPLAIDQIVNRYSSGTLVFEMDQYQQS